MSVIVGAFEAQANFAELLDRAAHGETITITRDGTPVAQLVPIDQSRPTETRRVVEGIKAMRAELRLHDRAVWDSKGKGRS